MADESRQRHLQQIAWGAGALAAALAVLFYLAALGVVEAPYRSAIVPTILVLLLVNWRLRAGKWWPDVRRPENQRR